MASVKASSYLLKQIMMSTSVISTFRDSGMIESELDVVHRVGTAATVLLFLATFVTVCGSIPRDADAYRLAHGGRSSDPPTKGSAVHGPSGRLGMSSMWKMISRSALRSLR